MGGKEEEGRVNLVVLCAQDKSAILLNIVVVLLLASTNIFPV